MKIDNIIDGLIKYRDTGKTISKTVLQEDIELCELVKKYLDLKKANLIVFRKDSNTVVQGTVVSVDLFNKGQDNLGLGITVQGLENNVYRISYEDVVEVTYKETSDLKNIYG